MGGLFFGIPQTQNGFSNFEFLDPCDGDKDGEEGVGKIEEEFIENLGKHCIGRYVDRVCHARNCVALKIYISLSKQKLSHKGGINLPK